MATSTAQATVQPTIGLLPIPRNPVISEQGFIIKADEELKIGDTIVQNNYTGKSDKTFEVYCSYSSNWQSIPCKYCQSENLFRNLT